VARDFDGTADYLISSGVPDGIYPLSMSCLVKVDSFSTSPYFFQYGLSSDANSRLGLNFTSGGVLEASVRSSSNIRTWATTAAVATDTWVNVVGTFTSSTVCAAFIDGVSAGSYTFTATVDLPAFNQTSLGALVRTSASNFLNGQIAEAAIWNAVLSQDEINMLTARMSPQCVRPQDLRAYWPLHGRAGSAGDEEDWVGTWPLTQISSPALFDHPRIIYPRRRSDIWVPAAAATAPTITALSAIGITATSAQPRITYA